MSNREENKKLLITWLVIIAIVLILPYVFGLFTNPDSDDSLTYLKEILESIRTLVLFISVLACNYLLVVFMIRMLHTNRNTVQNNRPINSIEQEGQPSIADAAEEMLEQEVGTSINNESGSEIANDKPTAIITTRVIREK